MKPIAHIYSDFSEKFGIPRQSLRAPSLTAKIVFEPEFRCDEALRGIEEFSHLWLIFDFSEAHREGFFPTVRPPRLGGNKRIGVFASRSPFRPNNIGLSSVRLLEVKKTENEGSVLFVSGADLLSGTPIYDIKPYLAYTDSHPDAKGSYADDFSDYRLEVDFPENLLKQIPEDKRAALIECLSDDPRPSYQDDRERIYSMLFADFDVKFRVDGGTLFVVDIKTEK
ncbi:MAG: tRNA (N6-threonylcarbamoyladenosine(37)-N6)-methyltransferase TrmO [Ruminococcaceae bacterium]|nr:tRNA (N6-threonylcarbamoyladenosine(37)-N6)-methyltransferase TrmO [Oscillospiraceae bacterium]